MAEASWPAWYSVSSRVRSKNASLSNTLLDGQLVEGYAVGGGHPADLGRAQAGNDQGAVGSGGARHVRSRAKASASSLGSSARARTVAVECPLTNSSVLASAMMRPLPMTSRWSAVWAISLMRWLERNTVRPSAASDFMRFRIHKMPSGSRPLIGSSNITVWGSPSDRSGDPEALVDPEREGPHPLAGYVTEPDDVEHVVYTAAGDAVAVGQPLEMVGGAAAAHDGLGIEQRPDRSERVGQFGIGPAVDED